MATRQNPQGIKQGVHTFNGVFRAIAVLPERRFVTELRDMAAHYDEDGNVRLIGEYQSGFVEICLQWHMIEDMHRIALRQREATPPATGSSGGCESGSHKEI